MMTEKRIKRLRTPVSAVSESENSFPQEENKMGKQRRRKE
jgi:hypothetical protein